MSAPRPVSLLGPQRFQQTVRDAIADLGVDGPLAIVTAGWEEREGEDQELDEHVGGRTRNLGLYPRAEEVFREDPSVRALLWERHDRLRDLQTLYRLRLGPMLESCRELLRRADPAAPDELFEPAIEDAIEDVRALDAHHLARAADLDAEIEERLAPEQHPAIARQRDELRGPLDGCEALLIAGGHVGVLFNRLRLFDILGLTPDLPVVAWSGGAMVLADRIVLFHDSPPQGPGDAEVYSPGLGLVHGIVPLPHAHQRLQLKDRARVALFARRFAPAVCAVLDGGERLDGTAGGSTWRAATESRVLSADGAVHEEVVA